MQANELKVGDIFRVDEHGYGNEPLECVDIQEYHVVYQPLNTSKLFNMSKGNKVVILEKEEEKNSDSEVHNPQRYNANNVECWDFIAKYELDYFIAMYGDISIRVVCKT